MARSLIALAAALALAGCGDDPTIDGPIEPAPRDRPSGERPAPAEKVVKKARCPANVAPGCRAVTGRVIFRELVDEDGDGDLHVGVAAGGITLPGATVIDVNKDLRPRRDPEIGDTVSGAGPVYPGSYGQRQIEAVVFNTAR